jgi:glycosyltransferase involved in cell wall biosynthesis
MYKNLIETVNTLDGLECEFIVVNDGSTDTTLEGAVRASKEFENVKIISYKKNRGKGYALTKGLDASKGDLIVFIDGDLDIHPRHVPKFLEVMRRTGSDVVVGSRKHPESIEIYYPFYRRLLSDLYHFLIKRTLVPISHQAGLKIYKREVLERIRPKLVTNRYSGEIEQLVLPHRLGYKIIEAPLEFKVNERKGMNAWSILYTGFETLAILYRLHITKFYDVT